MHSNKQLNSRQRNRCNEADSPMFDNLCTQSSDFDDFGIVTTGNGRVLSKYQWQREYTRINKDVKDKLRLWSPLHFKSPIKLKVIAEKHKSANRMLSPITCSDIKSQNGKYIVSIYNCS